MLLMDCDTEIKQKLLNSCSLHLGAWTPPYEEYNNVVLCSALSMESQ